MRACNQHSEAAQHNTTDMTTYMNYIVNQIGWATVAASPGDSVIGLLPTAQSSEPTRTEQCAASGHHRRHWAWGEGPSRLWLACGQRFLICAYVLAVWREDSPHSYRQIHPEPQTAADAVVALESRRQVSKCPLFSREQMTQA